MPDPDATEGEEPTADDAGADGDPVDGPAPDAGDEGGDDTAGPGDEGGTDGDRTGGVPPEDDWLSLRATLADRYTALVAVLLLLLLVGGGLTYTTHVDPGTHEEERTVATFTTTAQWEHAATVTEENAVFPVGRTLSDRSLYFTAVSPRLEGTFSYGYTASRGGNLSVDTTSTLVLHSVGEEEGERVEYWRVSEPLGRPRSERVADGDSLRTTFSTNVSALGERANRIESDLGGSPGETEARLLVRVRTNGTVNGRPVRRSEEYAATVELDDGTYRVTDASAERRRTNTTRTVTVQNTYGPTRRIGSPLLLLVSTVLLVGLVVAREGGHLEVPAAARERLSFRAEHEELDAWITRGSLPPDLDAPRVTVDSLEGLVDVAVDTERRVIEDPETGRFLVAGDGVVYVFDPPDHVRDPPTSDEQVDAGDDAGSGGDGDADTDPDGDDDSGGAGLAGLLGGVLDGDGSGDSDHAEGSEDVDDTDERGSEGDGETAEGGGGDDERLEQDGDDEEASEGGDGDGESGDEAETGTDGEETGDGDGSEGDGGEAGAE